MKAKIKAKVIHYSIEIFIFVLVMTIFSNVISLYKSKDLNKTQFNIRNTTLMNGSTFKVEEGKPLLVHFWATWCPTCKLEASNINAIAKDYQVLTIAVKSGSINDITHFLNENNLQMNVIRDIKGYEARMFKVVAYPTTFIYDKNGNLVFSDVGYTTTWGLWLRMWWANF